MGVQLSIEANQRVVISTFTSEITGADLLSVNV